MQKDIIKHSIPRVIIGSHKGGAGKTILTLSLISLFKDQGYKVAPFKKGPDYIDAGWLGKVANSSCRNLDLFLFGESDNLYSFYKGSKNHDLAIVEGNRGLFDGVDIEGSCSTESLAKLLKAPVIMVLDCTKATRSMAALLKGFIEFDPEVNIRGVILNNIATSRHESIIKNSIEKYTQAKVLGVIPRIKDLIKERHLGLITSLEEDVKFVENLKEQVKNMIDLQEIFKIASSAPPLLIPLPKLDRENSFGIKIGVFYDSAFQFYYPENLEALRDYGAELVFLNSFETKSIPSDISALYLGGGFPEIYAEKLAENDSFKRELKFLIEEGMPVYAECGGLLFLGEEMEWQEKKFPMTGILPIKFKISKKPYGHGYVKAKVVGNNPFYPLGEIIKGHEFHYSYPYEMNLTKNMELYFNLKRG